MNTVIENRNISELIDIVKGDFSKLNQEGLIDEGAFIKTIMYCNERLGIQLREVREVAISIKDNVGELPLDFDKLYYVAALNCSNSNIALNNPFDNNVDQDVIYKAHLDRECLGNVQNYKVTVERQGQQIIHHYNNWTQINIKSQSFGYCHTGCPNKKGLGKYEVEIKDGKIIAPFRSGVLYIIYIGLMQDSEGNLQYPFHPLVTPYYEWSIKEKILSDAIFNSEGENLANLYKLAQSERVKSWTDAFNFVVNDTSFGQYKASQRKRELNWHHQWFKFFQ